MWGDGRPPAPTGCPPMIFIATLMYKGENVKLAQNQMGMRKFNV